MDTWETHFRSAVSESGASRSLVGLHLTNVDFQAYMGRLVANEESATLNASGSMNYRASDDVDPEEDCEDLNLDSDTQKRWLYTVKIINPNGMVGYELHPLDTHETFNHIQEMKEYILTSCQEYIEKEKEFHFGYIKPGHGKNGKQIELLSDDDVHEMYSRFKKVVNILLWIKHSVVTVTRKHVRTPAGAKEYDSGKRSRVLSEPETSTSGGHRLGRSNYDKHIEKMAAVDEICEELSAKHGDKYTPEQYRCWANLIQLKRHDCYDSPPKKRFFTEKSGGTVTGVGVGVSPNKRITMRSECMSQLDKWHSLKGASSRRSSTKKCRTRLCPIFRKFKYKLRCLNFEYMYIQ